MLEVGNNLKCHPAASDGSSNSALVGEHQTEMALKLAEARDESQQNLVSNHHGNPLYFRIRSPSYLKTS